MAKSSLPKINSFNNPSGEVRGLEGVVFKSPSHKAKNLTGRTFTYLRAIACVGVKLHGGTQAHTVWLTQCICGSFSILGASDLMRKSTQSCGCKRYEMTAISNRRHGHASCRNGHKASAEFGIYMQIKGRCNTPTNHAYHRYGGRGIKCNFPIFEDFLTEIGPRPSPYHSVDRIDNDGHYEVGNVRWATRFEQARNRSNNVYLTIDGVTKAQKDWGIISPVTEGAIIYRLKKGWCAKCAVFLKPTRGEKMVARCDHTEMAGTYIVRTGFKREGCDVWRLI